MKLRHPSEAQLALYSGNDLGFWERRTVRRHVEACPDCRQTSLLHQTDSDQLRDLAGQMPTAANWGRLSQEMAGNIRVGLDAGRCIEGFEKSLHAAKPRFFWHTAAALCAASAVMLAALWLNLPDLQKEHLAFSLKQIGVRWERIGEPVRGWPGDGAAATPLQDAVVLEAGPSAIAVKSNGRAMTLLHPGSDGGAVSVNMEDSAGVRYVDADTGQVTMNRVYYAQ